MNTQYTLFTEVKPFYASLLTALAGAQHSISMMYFTYDYGEWSSDGHRFTYSTAERTEGSPGWKADNDLWIASFVETGTHPISVTLCPNPERSSRPQL